LIEPSVNGHVLDDPRDIAELGKRLSHWRERGPAGAVKTRRPLGLDLNVQLTLKVLEQAAKERELP
jgi:hypothetical protein